MNSARFHERFSSKTSSICSLSQLISFNTEYVNSSTPSSTKPNAVDLSSEIHELEATADGAAFPRFVAIMFHAACATGGWFRVGSVEIVENSM